MTAHPTTVPTTSVRNGATSTPRRAAPVRCLWCGREVEQASGVGRKRRYCGQACRQRAYEARAALERGGLPADAVMLTAAEREALSDRLFQVSCAAQDVQTALDEGAGPEELRRLVSTLVDLADQAEVLR